MKLHKLLERQIQKTIKDTSLLQVDEIKNLLEKVNATYESLEKDKNRAERAFQISEQEYQEVNNVLSLELNQKKISIQSLSEAFSDIKELDNKEDIAELASIIKEEVKNRKSAESTVSSLLTNIHVGILLEDRNRVVQFANPKLGAFFGIPDVQNLKGIDCAEALQNLKGLFKDPEGFLERIDTCILEKKLVTAETVELKDGRTFLRDYIPIFSDQEYDGHLWTYTEITEKREYENTIIESERRNRLVMNAALDAIITINVKGEVTFWNPQAEKVFGWKTEEVIGKKLNGLIIPQIHRSAHNEGMKKYMATGHGPALNQKLELPALKKDGTQITIELYILPIGENHNLFFCSFIRDITARKEIEQEKNRLSLIASANENGILFLNSNEDIVWCNEGIIRLTGFSQDQIKSIHPYQLFHGPLSEIADWNKLYKQYKKGKSIRAELIFYRKDKTWFWARVKGQALKVENQEGNYFFMIEDITSEKEVQSLLKEYDEKLKIALNSVGDNYWEHDFEKDETTFLNPNNFLLGYKLDEIKTDISTFWWNAIHPDDKPILQNLDEGYKAGTRKEHNCQYRVKTKNGGVEWVIDRGTVTEVDRNGKPKKIIGTHTNITKQKGLENQLILAKEAAESSSKAKQMFLANMSHEIRTPMNAIVGMANQIKKTELTEKQRFYVQTIESSADNLLVIINDILDLSKIEAGELSIEKIGFEPRKVLSNIMQVMSFKAEEKGLLFTNSFCDVRLAPVLIGDPYRLNQIFLNLVSNAIKFTEKGSVDIQCHLKENREDLQILEGRVIDTGIGMDQEFISRVFQKFKQEDDSVTRKFGGTGLGMSICKELIELMGGEIGVESKKGHGTLVYFRIPMQKGKKSDLPETAKKTMDLNMLRGKRILVADDNDMNRLVASTILNNYGVEILEAKNGEEAINQCNNNPDLVLMDVQMPIMDGLEATKKIRELYPQEIPVIALTALALKGEEVKFKQAGMNDYVLKPFQEERLLEVICSYLNQGVTPITAVNTPALYNFNKLEALAGDPVFIQKMKELFLSLAKETLLSMKKAFAQNDYGTISKLAHKIKPSIDNMSIESITQVVRDIEKNAQLLGGTKDFNIQFAFFCKTLQQVIDEMEK